jgi:hypothetical protein
MMRESSTQNVGVMMKYVGVYGDFLELPHDPALRHMRTPDLKHELRVYPGVFARKGHKKEVTSEKGSKRVQYCNKWWNWL